jgi:hypothetical protein
MSNSAIMSKRQPGCDPKVPDSVTHAENPVEELRTDRRRISLRVKVPAEDGTAVVEMTSPGVPENGLQAFGDWVLAALEQHADGAAEAARLMIAALRERDWEGDDALADQLDALLEGGAIPDLRPLPVDLDELAGILEGDPMYGGGRVDLATGEIWPAPAIDYAREIGQEDEDESDDPDKWLWVHCEGSRDGYRDMELFIGTVRDPGRADRMEIAISGRSASPLPHPAALQPVSRPSLNYFALRHRPGPARSSATSSWPRKSRTCWVRSPARAAWAVHSTTT